MKALNTTSRGASKTLVMTMSCRPGSMMNSVSAMVLPFLVVLDLPDLLIEPIEPVSRDLPVPLDPLGRGLQWCRFETAGPPLCLAAPGDQPGPFEHFEVLGDRLEADGERLGQLIDRRLALANRARIARRVGSASAANVTLS